ncbi:MAG TPA: rod shape-determining protein MreD [Stellaceae bacterium]|nr:rod shape-determining protein MreD [Stellaceae bacterium]
MAFNAFLTPAAPRADSAAARLLPIATTMLAALLSILALPIPGYAALTPAFTLMAVYHWTIYRPDLLPAASLFAIGFAVDLIAGAPLGVTSLLLLLTRALVLSFRRSFRNRRFPFVWAGFAVLTGVAMPFLWALNSLLDMTLLESRTTLFRAALTVSVFPAASFLLGRTQRALMAGG